MLIFSAEFEQIKSSKPVTKGDSFVENLATYLYLKAVLLRHTQQLDAAITYIEKLSDISTLVQREVYLVPHGYCEKGEILVEQGKLVAAKEQFKKAKEYFDYDFDKPLLRRIENSLDKIKKTTSSMDTMSLKR